MKEKIDKLTAHEKSARRLGNTAEADAYKKKIDELKRREVESGARQNDVVGSRGNGGVGGGRWICSCGYELVLSNDDSAGDRVIVDIMLSAHRRDGHRLTLAD